MSLKVHGPRTIRILSKHIDQTKKFYTTLFGLKPLEEIPGFVSCKLEHVTIEIVLEDTRSPASTGGTVVYWQVESIEACIEEILKLGATIYRGPLVVKETGLRIIQILEPGGTILGFEAKI